MEKFEVKAILKTNEVKENVEIIFNEDNLELIYKNENSIEKIQYDTIGRMKYASENVVGLFYKKKVYAFFRTEFKSYKNYKFFLENIDKIMFGNYENKVRERLSAQNDFENKSLQLLINAIVIYMLKYQFEIKNETIYSIIAEKYKCSKNYVKEEINKAIENIIKENTDKNIKKRKFISKIAEEILQKENL